MSELMDKILAGKLKTRKELDALPFDQKLDIMEKMRERSVMLSENSLRKPKGGVSQKQEASGTEVLPEQKQPTK